MACNTRTSRLPWKVYLLNVYDLLKKARTLKAHGASSRKIGVCFPCDPLENYETGGSIGPLVLELMDAYAKHHNMVLKRSYAHGKYEIVLTVQPNIIMQLFIASDKFFFPEEPLVDCVVKMLDSSLHKGARFTVDGKVILSNRKKQKVKRYCLMLSAIAGGEHNVSFSHTKKNKLSFVVNEASPTPLPDRPF